MKGIEGAVPKLQLVAAKLKPFVTFQMRRSTQTCQLPFCRCGLRKKGHLARKCRSATQPRKNRGNTRGAAHMMEEHKEKEEGNLAIQPEREP